MFYSGWWKSVTALNAYLILHTACMLGLTISGINELRRNQNTSGMYPYQTGFEAIGIVAFASVLVHLVFQIYLSPRNRFLTTMGCLSIYLLSYAVLSSAGDYHASRSGRYRWKTAGLAVSDESVWHAKGVFFNSYVDLANRTRLSGTTLGWFYSPLVYLDRLFWHDSFNMFEDDLNEWLKRHPDEIQHN